MTPGGGHEREHVERMEAKSPAKGLAYGAIASMVAEIGVFIHPFDSERRDSAALRKF